VAGVAGVAAGAVVVAAGGVAAVGASSAGRSTIHSTRTTTIATTTPMMVFLFKLSSIVCQGTLLDIFQLPKRSFSGPAAAVGL
jgi:hypothetical protein